MIFQLSFYSHNLSPMTSSDGFLRIVYLTVFNSQSDININLELICQTQVLQNGSSNSSLLQLLPPSFPVPSLKELNLVPISVSSSFSQ